MGVARAIFLFSGERSKVSAVAKDVTDVFHIP